MKSSLKSAPPHNAIDWLLIVEQLLRAAYIALLFLAVLVPSDTPADQGMFAAQSAGWCLLAMGVTFWLVFRRRSIEWGVIDTLAVAYLLWTAVAAFAVWGVGDLRGAINSFFQTAAFILVLLLGRQLLTTDQQRRSLLTAIIALGSAMAMLGLLQFLIFDPINHAEIKAQPELLLKPLGILDHNSPEAQRALARALSPEPLGTFTLTNSLACFLVPWVIVLIAAIAYRPACLPARSPAGALERIRMALVPGVAALAVLAACLWLTHSRMSILALSIGLTLLAGMWLHSRGWRYLAWGGGAVLAIGVIAALILMVGESSAFAAASTSARFRLEYWQSTWQIIVDHWLLGVGPGNFKSVYPRYKLPQASEEIGDPHNFVLEVWATAGTPAALLLVLLLTAVLWKWWVASGRTAETESPGRSASAEKASTVSFFSSEVWTLGGAAVAFVLVVLIGPIYSAMYPWILAPLTAICYFALRPLVSDAVLRGPALVVAGVAMLVNLLAAGGMGFPSVAIPLALLLTLISFSATSITSAGPATATTFPSRPPFRIPFSLGSILGVGGSAALYFACYFLCYLPVMRADAVDLGERMAADPFSPEVCRQFARSELESLELGNPEALPRMEEALGEAVRRDPRSHVTQFWAGDVRLRAYRATKRPELLAAALDNYQRAAERYPNWSLVHAQLAWVSHIAGDDARAAAAAQEALRLDALCPHEDRKLRRQVLHDTALTPLRLLPLDAAMKRLAKGGDTDR